MSASADVPVAPRAARSVPKRNRRWPRTLAALSVPNYRLFLSSQVVATTGLWMQRIAQDWLVLELTGSVTAVGVAVALQFLPVLLFGLLGGVIADRYPKRRILIITQSVAAALALILGTLALTGTVQAWHVYVVAAALGFVTVVDNPTRQVFVSELVGPRHMQNAVSLNSSVFQFGALVGPALSGLLIAAVGQGWSFLINAAACLGRGHHVDHAPAGGGRRVACPSGEGPAHRGAALHPAHLRGGLVDRPRRRPSACSGSTCR